jgi:hypothetical protein
MTPSEVYLPAGTYQALVDRLVTILRTGRRSLYNPGRSIARDRLIMELTAALRARAVPMGAAIVTGEPPRLISGERAALVEALADLEPDCVTGRFEADGVKWALGEVGNVWPADLLICQDVAASCAHPAAC